MAPPPAGTGSADPSFARYGDYLSAQMQSNRSFGYGIFICTMRPAKGPVCSTFWLYSNEPSPVQSPDVAQNWRWNEVDFEFVPETQATQAAYATFDGDLPSPAVTVHAATVNMGDPRSQVLDPATISWTKGFERTDEAIAKQMWDYYNTWMTAQTGGAPTGGTFTLADGGTSSTTSAL
ncbi:MAG TPA: hypothetical protein VHB25_16010, partial [Gemmatimonadaceae bacterium]|nr:hypothetical protein [Gemmatimonadaceae bacterium]